MPAVWRKTRFALNTCPRRQPADVSAVTVREPKIVVPLKDDVRLRNVAAENEGIFLTCHIPSEPTPVRTMQ